MSSPNPKLPIAALLLIAANIVAAFVLVYQPGLAPQLGFDPQNPSAQDALASLFLHANLFHLAGNMLFLAAVGPSVELSTGTVRFVLVYFAAGLVGVLAHWAMSSRALEPTVLIGASSSLAGCIGYYSVRYSSLKVPIAPRLVASVAIVTIAWAALQVIGGFVGGSGVGYWSHLGGFATGLVLSLVYKAPSLQVVEERARRLREAGARSAGAMLAESSQALSEAPKDPEALRVRIAALRQLGDSEEEAEALLELLEADPTCDSAAVSGRLVLLGFAHRIPSLRRIACAEAVAQEDLELARLLLESVAAGPADDPRRPEAMLGLAELELERVPARAQHWLDLLRQEYPLHPSTELARRRGWSV